ncbi:3-ketoacyl-CoA thiolase, mitochondrial-like [Galleria mellonella]|uniref:3-ketoacyl-CoA thiolase, mitochondrial-like n=1 Tax=Galleria mellonella TaxID=7137 RepID=A0A6J1WLW1_GALME|nr:3-ketoacyl-CoA thiolase, mitochondrial-like [Galleria mellonella]
MALPSKGIFIIGAKRTPFCGYGGALRDVTASQMFAAAAKDAIRTSNIDPTSIDNTIVGNVHFLSQCDGGKTPRYCGIYSGVPIERPALGVNKACGSGLQTVVNAAVDIITGLAKTSLIGGTEHMSSLPHLVRNVRFGSVLGISYKFEDYIKNQFLDSYSGLTLEKLAEDLAKKYQITREEIDDFALQSHLKWKAAQEANIFDKELTNMTVTMKKKEITVDKDGVPQPNINTEQLSQLPAILDDGSLITTGNSSPPADGAAALIITGEESVERNKLLPLARVAAWSCVGTDPLETGLGAVPAVKRLLEVSGVGVNDVDIFEINETFSSQALISAKQLNIDPNKVNVNGGAVALGNPVAATGARMAVHIVHEMSRRKLKRAVAASSCGGGQGVAVMFEAV